MPLLGLNRPTGRRPTGRLAATEETGGAVVSESSFFGSVESA